MCAMRVSMKLQGWKYVRQRQVNQAPCCRKSVPDSSQRQDLCGFPYSEQGARLWLVSEPWPRVNGCHVKRQEREISAKGAKRRLDAMLHNCGIRPKYCTIMPVCRFTANVDFNIIGSCISIL